MYCESLCRCRDAINDGHPAGLQTFIARRLPLLICVPYENSSKLFMMTFYFTDYDTREKHSDLEKMSWWWEFFFINIAVKSSKAIDWGDLCGYFWSLKQKAHQSMLQRNQVIRLSSLYEIPYENIYLNSWIPAKFYLTSKYSWVQTKQRSFI